MVGTIDLRPNSPTFNQRIDDDGNVIDDQGQDVIDTQVLRDIVADLPEKSVPVLIKRESRSTFLALRKEETE